jgi:hypothetical protein
MNLETLVKTVNLDADVLNNIKKECDVAGAENRRLAGSFLTQIGGNSFVVLIFQNAPA